MKIVHRRRGEQVCISDSLDVSVLTISPDAVTFAICDSNPEASVQNLSRPMAEACKNKACYFWFPSGGRCMLVARCNIGQSGVALGAARLQFLGHCGDTARIVVDESSKITAETATASVAAGGSAPLAMQTSCWPEQRRRNSTRISLPIIRSRWDRVPRLLLGQLAASLAAIVHR